MFSVSVNDLVEELYEENNRLLNELLLTEKCFELLSETKDIIEFNFVKYENNIDSNNLQKYKELINKINDIIELKNCKIDVKEEEFDDNDVEFDIDDDVEQTEEEYHDNNVVEDEDVEQTVEESSDSYSDNDSQMSDDSDNNCSSDEKKNKKTLSQSIVPSVGSKPEETPERKEVLVKEEKPKFVLKSAKSLTSLMSFTGLKISNDEVLCSVFGCGHKFNSSDALKEHIVEVHVKNNEGRIRCTHAGCDRSFRTEGLLHSHTFKFHTDFPCELEGCEFVGNKQELKKHQVFDHR